MVLAIERPHKSGQMYIATGLKAKYHFSCPTVCIPSLLSAIQKSNNKDVALLFIPRSTQKFVDSKVTVINDVPTNSIFQNDGAATFYDAVLEAGDKLSSGSLATSGQRCNYSFSIGLQTMYAHQQHHARYSMLAHSRLHIPTVRKYPQGY
jgi:hypothetical protein